MSFPFIHNLFLNLKLTLGGAPCSRFGVIFFFKGEKNEQLKAKPKRHLYFLIFFLECIFKIHSTIRKEFFFLIIKTTIMNSKLTLTTEKHQVQSCHYRVKSCKVLNSVQTLHLFWGGEIQGREDKSFLDTCENIWATLMFSCV